MDHYPGEGKERHDRGQTDKKVSREASEKGR
jgi:hypothetical protein